MDKTYDPPSIEQKWASVWENEGYFQPQGDGEPYCIMLPPPNVTGSLHMGHGFQHTLMDALVRYHRMRGFNTLWQPGTDHAGISTQMVVEQQLLAQGKTRHDLGREAFVDKIWQWRHESGNRISLQLRRLGSSVDWSRERFTMDETLSKAVQKVFIDLYREGLIYRGKRLVNWDPQFNTAISDLEVNASEEAGHLWHIRYPLVDSDDYIVVATTRPETLLGDVAVAVNPTDERYQSLLGQMISHPLTNRQIPIIADDYVDPAFGSGCVKITPAHDFNDYTIALRHDLPMINIFTPQATLNDEAPLAYRGLDRYAARDRIIADLTQLNLLEKISDHTVNIPRGEKSGAVIEPLLTDQWFIKMESLAKPALAAVEQDDIRFIPSNWRKTYCQWLENIEDWCISRQLWWGHRIPAWYDEAGNIYVGENEDRVRSEHKLNQEIGLRQDEDVLDTWFSSALWPFSTLGWPAQTAPLATFYPTNVLVTGFDIIFFWVARMVMMGLKFTNKIPFHEVYITGLIRDAEGKKMSKSKGNVLDPLDIIDGISLTELLNKRTSNLMLTSAKDKIIKQTKQEFPDGIPAFGTDALRFTFCALASTGRDIRFDLGRVEGYRNFCNKLWNAARYVLMNTAEEQQDLGDGPLQYNMADQWILSRLQHTIAQAHRYFKEYRFDLLANELYNFVWHEYCDWYLELSKPVLYDEEVGAAQKRGTRHTLLHGLTSILKLLHPLMPFITEEIWQRVAPLADEQGATIMLQSFPDVDESQLKPEVEAEIEWVKQVILGIRNVRGEMNISPSQSLTVFFHKGDEQDKQRLATHRHFLQRLARLESINWLKPTDQAPISITALAGQLEILIPMAGLVDKQAELDRLAKAIAKVEQDRQRVQTKLANPNFTDKAPEHVVAKEQEKLTKLQQKLTKLNEQLHKIELL
jgi:valyl-tRNA synthetase